MVQQVKSEAADEVQIGVIEARRPRNLLPRQSLSTMKMLQLEVLEMRFTFDTSEALVSFWLF